ncbi:hypothetical protein ATH84_104423 [Paracoccus versutus]|uniref:Uncharacterized protein n=1 Tax=Paracoccus versutus TaxID=34007 RepID=A0AAQ0HEK6_PARVE|nr:hypothetical protein ATH84_104423 [Paracoccus versutus]
MPEQSALAGLIAGWNGYALHEGFAQRCIVFETDICGMFCTMAGMGWLMLISLLFPRGVNYWGWHGRAYC